MPVISFEYRDLQDMMGEMLPLEEFMERIPLLGVDIGEEEDGVVELEVFPNRPDNFSVEGLARSARAFFGYRTGLSKYPIRESDQVMKVDPSVKAVRPVICCGVVRNVNFTDPFIKSVMAFQEKLHLTLGRKRKKVAIGIHDMQKITPPYTYAAVPPESMTFVPLGHTEPMNLAEILEDHEKGRDYAWVLEGKELYPIITDREGTVLSFPPIINGTQTEVREDSQDVFLDITGTDETACHTALNILASLFAERGGTVETVKVIYPDGEQTMPDLKPTRWELDNDYSNRVLGLDLKPQQTAECLERMGFGTQVEKGRLLVDVPAWRSDILHPVDLVEDVAIGHGYHTFSGTMPTSVTFGSGRKIEDVCRSLRELLVGLGYLELLTQSLSNRDHQFGLWNEPETDAVGFTNPINEDLTIMRLSLLPSMMSVLRANKHRDLPQKVFEIDDVVIGGKNRRFIAGASTHSKASFTEIKSICETLLDAVGAEYDLEAGDHGGFIRGRYVVIQKDGKHLGSFGEVHPMTLESYDLGNPLVAFEFDMELLTGIARGGQ